MQTVASLKVLFLTQWFEPEPVMKGSAFAKAIADQGHQVEVATGFPNYPGGKLYPGYRVRLYQSEVIDGIKIHRLPLYPSHDHSSWRRALNYLSFMVSALLFCLLRGGRYDVIYVYHPPLTVGFAAALTGMVTRTPFVIDVQDLWPDSVVSSGMAHTGRLATILGAACRFVYRKAAVVVAQSNGMREEIARREVEAEVVTIFNWADEASFAHSRPAPETLGLADHFTFLYAGNMGRAQALDTMIEAAERAARIVPNLQLLLIGSGVDCERLKALVAASRVVRILPPVNRKEIAAICQRVDVLALHLADDPLFQITLPSKLQFYLASGRPVLVGVAGEASRIVIEARAGIAVPPQDATAMANAMVTMARMSRADLADMAANARVHYERRFSFVSAIAETDAVLRKVACVR